MTSTQQELQKELTSSSIIRFQDCDPFGHLNNARYFDYFLNAREDQLIKHYDFDIYKIAKETGKSWVVNKNEIVYLKPALLMEPVQIKTSLIGFNENSIMVEGQMFNADFSHIKSILWVKFVHIGLKDGKSIPHSDDWMSFFSKVLLNDEYNKLSFDHRVSQMLAEFKLNKALVK